MTGTDMIEAERWPNRDLAHRCDEVLNTGGVLLVAWPTVEQQRLASDGRRAPASPGAPSRRG